MLDIKELCFDNYINKSRALCIDYGDKRIGVAVTDIGWNIASPLTVLDSHGVFPKLTKIIEEYNIGIMVIGAPKSLSGGGSGLQLEKIKKFAEKLEEVYPKVSIVYWDERLSSVAANRCLVEAEMTHAKKRQNIDKVAACFILQGFVDYASFNRNQKV